MTSRILSKAIVALFCIAGATGSASALTGLLPTPGDGSGAVYGTYKDGTGATRDAILLNGIPIAFKYDDNWSYSAKVLNALQGDGFLPSATFGTYNFATGTGGLDLLLMTGSGAKNTNVGPGGAFTFQNPGQAPTGNDQTGTGTWGSGATGAPVLVGNLLNYLHAVNPLNSVPVFYVDWNQTGSGDSILANARMRIYDPATYDPNNPATYHEWALDTKTQAGDGSYDNASVADQALNYGNISFYGTQADCTTAGLYNPITGTGCAGVTANGHTYLNLDHNNGSGKADFIFYAPTLDLSKFNPNYVFDFGWNIGCTFGTYPNGTPPVDTGNNKYTVGCTNNGFEEIFLTGAIGVPTIVVPEPGSLALLGLGLAGLAGLRRRATSQVA